MGVRPTTTLPSGCRKNKRAFRSTKQTNHKQALRVALEWENASELQRRGELTDAASRRVLDLIRGRASVMLH